MSNWKTLGYEPNVAIATRLQLRQVRTARRTMLRFFNAHGHFVFAARLQAIRDNPRLNGATKRIQFQKVLDDYARSVNPQPQATETSSVEMERDALVVLPSAGADKANGLQSDPDRGVSDVADEIVGE